ncbi:MAG: hypothetical protein ACYDBY_15270 [Thermoanaerobaculia bacterium]
MADTKRTVKVSRGAVIKRIRRHHARDGAVVRKNRSTGSHAGESDYYVVDGRNYVVDGFDENALEDYARTLGVLAPTEWLASE